MRDDHQRYRFGSAEFASAREIRRAGMLTQKPHSLLLGFLGRRPLWYEGAGGLLLSAGARGGKLRDVLAYNVCCGVYAAGSMVILDMKGELAAISQDQTADHKFCLYWNPAALHALPQHRINPVDYLRLESPTLVSDAKVFCENMIPPTGSAQGVYFEGRAREFLEALVLTLVRVEGVLNLPRLFEVLNFIPGGGEAWLNFAFEMQESGFPIARRVEEEIASSRDDAGNGFKGILGELLKAFAALSDPVLLNSVSPPFDASLKETSASDQAYQLYIMPPAEFVGAWASVIKAFFVAGMLYKSRAPAAPSQTWILDECAQLGGFPLVPKLFTYGAGIGIRPWAVYQSSDQLKATAPNAQTIIPASAACRSYFAIRDLQSAEALSRMLGAQTLDYVDEHRAAQAKHAKRQALQSVIAGGDPLAAGMEMAHHRRLSQIPHKQHRWLRTPDEVLSMPGNKQFIICDGLERPIYADRKAYYDQAFMAGRYHPNPYHPPADQVRIKTGLRHRWRAVITEPVPARFSHYPQYQHGQWSRIEG